ncbi:hypothetical protein [Polycladidibacter hongkongensis]|uniref:hypothetical protein n=1 Tax=Polycladidibacter hongkongensis TaxID=1647556 RepID=UPI000A41520F|nr:hypothetical protein [Pseudovibrio hongkongensis]
MPSVSNSSAPSNETGFPDPQMFRPKPAGPLTRIRCLLTGGDLRDLPSLAQYLNEKSQYLRFELIDILSSAGALQQSLVASSYAEQNTTAQTEAGTTATKRNQNGLNSAGLLYISTSIIAEALYTALRAEQSITPQRLAGFVGAAVRVSMHKAPSFLREAAINAQATQVAQRLRIAAMLPQSTRDMPNYAQMLASALPCSIWADVHVNEGIEKRLQLALRHLQSEFAVRAYPKAIYSAATTYSLCR